MIAQTETCSEIPPDRFSCRTLGSGACQGGSGALLIGLGWDTAQLYNDGTLRVISTHGLTFAKWATTVLGDDSATPTGDHELDGLANAIKFALSLIPPQPVTVLPDGEIRGFSQTGSTRRSTWSSVVAPGGPSKCPVTGAASL